jgi:hypothetical protein
MAACAADAYVASDRLQVIEARHIIVDRQDIDHWASQQ